MSLHRSSAWTLTVILLAGVAGYQGLQPSSGLVADSGFSASSPRVVAAKQGIESGNESWGGLVAPQVPSGTTITDARRVELGSMQVALVAEASALQQLGGSADVGLDVSGWSAFAEVSAEFQAVRQAYEATIAVPTLLEGGRYRLTVPLYSDAGDALRSRFYEQLREKLGDDATARVAQQMGTALEGYFGGFGVAVQTLEFAPDAAGSERDYAVTRTLTYWNEAGQRLTSRRETHFPGIEDPAGERWGPFLSVLATHVAAKAKS